MILKTLKSNHILYFGMKYLLRPLRLLIANGQARLILLIGMFQAEKSWHVFNLQDLVIYLLFYLGSKWNYVESDSDIFIFHWYFYTLYATFRFGLFRA